jgi:hypothetical protein
MMNQTTKQLECATCYFKQGMSNNLTDSMVDQIMAVLIEKHDAGEKTSQYQSHGRVFKLIMEEVK